jgi:hypothetical protein
MKRAAIAVAVLIATAAGLVIWERSKWTQDRDVQCVAARPLIGAAGPRQQVIDVLGKPSIEYGRADWPEIVKQFGSAQKGDKLRDINERLSDHGRLLVYSRSNSIMFLYLDAGGRTSHASCFLQ